MQVPDHTKYICEFIGTFMLVFFAAGAAMVSALSGSTYGALTGGLASGLALAVVIRIFADFSGGHVNPALTLTLVWLGSFPRRLLPGYVLAQLAGSLAAGMTLLALLGEAGQMGANLPAASLSPFQGLIIEALLSFIMMLVILGTTSGPSASPAQAPFWIGAVVGVEVMLFGGIAGAAMNPARAFGPFVVMGDWQYFWIYMLGPVVGIAMAGWSFTAVFKPSSA